MLNRRVDRSIKSQEGFDIDTEKLVSNINTITEHIDNIDTTVKNKTNIDIVSNGIGSINTVSANINNVNTTAEKISDICLTANNTENINTIASDISSIKTTANSIENVNITGKNINHIKNVANIVSAVQSVSQDTANINTVASDISAIKTTANNINNINTAALNNNSITAVGNSINSINAVANDLTNINSASLYANNAKIWTEGSDEEVQSLGGEHSAKEWVYLASGLDPDLTKLSNNGKNIINQSKAFETGAVNDNTDIYNDIFGYSHSTFDLAKFTVIGSPQITNDGIASEFSSTSYLTKTLDFRNASSWKVCIGFTTPSSVMQVYINDDLVYQPCLKIPYTLSATSSKIADVIYRDRVEDLYNQYGYAPYYTIDEANQNFTLPMGEIYGMIQRSNDDIDLKADIDLGNINPSQSAKNNIISWIMPDYANGISVSSNANYSAPAAGYISFVPFDNTSTVNSKSLEISGYISINGYTVLTSTYVMGSDSSHPDSGLFPISKNETVYHTMNHGTVYFYPMKGAN